MGGFTASVTRLLALPEGKRAIQPYSFAYTYWNFNSDKGLTGVSGSSVMYTDAGVAGSCANIYGTPWANQGLSLGLCAWNKVLTQIGNSGGIVDYMFADVEGGEMFSNWSLEGITGITGAFLRNLNYAQTWNGVTSLSSQMSIEGATISKVFPRSGFDYLIWTKSTRTLVNALLNKVLWEPTISSQPNIVGSNYDFKDTGSTYDSPPDLNGHPNYVKSIFGNAASPVLYGVIGQLATAWKIDPTDTTRILLGATTNPLYTVSRSPWNSFLLDMQTIRSAKRTTPNTPLTPWIGSPKYAGVDQAGVSPAGAPPVGYADVTSGYNADIGYTFGSAGNSAYYYEMVRHASLHGVKAFGYFNDNMNGNVGLTQRAGLLNTVLTEINNNIGSYRLDTATSARVDWLAKQLTSGTAKSWNNYIWRTTIEPGTIYEHTTTDNTNYILSGSCVGKWFNTTTSTPPDVRPLELKDIFYFPGVYSTDGSTLEHGTGTSLANWFGTNISVISAFQGDKYTDNFGTKVINGRAYEFEMDPANPTVTSPWHNAIYENCIDPYMWGARSFTFFQPHGQIPQVSYPFREITRRADGYYNSTTDASKSPARWKGFTSGVRALLEGKLNPVGACAAKTGFTAMSEPCNVHVYLPSTNGYWENRFGNMAAGPAGDTFYPGSLLFWDKCFTSTGTVTGANDLYYASVNQWINEFISMKSPSITAGILSCSIDATTCSATPNTVGLFATLPAAYTRGNSYELTDWYISQTLRANNIPVYCEARPQKTFSLLNSGITSGEISNIPGLCGATAISQWTNHFSIEYWLWYSNPNNPVLTTQDPNFTGALPDSEAPSVMRYSQNSGPMPNDRDPYQIPLIVATGGTAYLLPYGFPSYNTSPQRALLDLYSATDVYRKFNNLANTGLTFRGVVYDKMTRGMLFTGYGDWARGTCGLNEISATANSGSLTGYYKLNVDVQSEGNRIGYGPTQPRKFDRTAFIANTTNYANNSQGQSGYWMSSGISFWRDNVKQPTFNGFLEMLKQVSLTGCPKYGNTLGWTGATYPNDFYGLGIFPKSMRP